MNFPLKNMSVLIVDDNPTNIQVLVGTLRDMCRARVANGGLQAVRIAESDDPPDVILLDIMMPGIDGYEVCRRLKDNPRTMHIPIMFITSKSTSEDEAFGINLGAVDYIPKPFSPAVVKARVRTQLQLKQRTDLLERLALLDALTGVPNRRCLDDSLDREWRRAVRTGDGIALVMIDIDYFKAYNDNYGHGAGDECLRQTAQALRAVASRPGDVVARYGGEEFCALLPHTDMQGAALMAEKLRRAVEDLALPHDFSQAAACITVSVGYASTTPPTEDSPASLMKRADFALYQAQELGRNRVHGG